MLRPILVLMFLLLTLTIESAGQDRSYGRSVVMTDRGIVATSDYLASQAGAQVLAKGGTAMDAAIAANAAKAAKLYGLNSSGWAPRRLSVEFLTKQGITSMPGDGIHSVTVPGAVEGWSQAHRRFGRLPWKDLFPPAIYYAEYGYAVPEIVHGYWVPNEPKMQKTSEARRVFLPGGKAPELGAKFSNPDVAKALRLIAEQGRDAFYKGDIAQAIISTSAGLSGTMQLDDLADPSSFGDLDENDPKSVARWARKLGQQMGEDLGDDWGEMVDKLEAGEDMGEESLGEPPDSEGIGAGPPDF